MEQTAVTGNPSPEQQALFNGAAQQPPIEQKSRLARLSLWLQAQTGVWIWVPRLILQLVEFFTVLVIFSGVLYAAYWMVMGGFNDPHRQRMVALLTVINDNWKGLAILTVLLFYRTIRTFIEEVQEFAGAKRRSSPQGQGTSATNRPVQ